MFFFPDLRCFSVPGYIDCLNIKILKFFEMFRVFLNWESYNNILIGFKSKRTSFHSVQLPQSSCSVWHTFSLINWVKLCSHFHSFVTNKWPGFVPVLAVTAWSHDFSSWFALLMFSVPAGPANPIRVKIVAYFTEIQHFNEAIIISNGCF